jgi:2-oxoglutarate ferredoxin oxidoreductase subunit alpha
MVKRYASQMPEEIIKDVVIRLAGNSQDGIQTIGGFLARFAGRSSQEVITYMTIPSTIAGGPSIFQVHMGSGEVLSAGDTADFLVAFYQHSYEDHIDSLKESGVLIYDTDNVEPDLQDKRFIYVGVSITGLTIEAVGGTGKSKGKNIFVLGLLARVFSLKLAKLRGLIEERFKSKGEDVLRNALLAFDAGYSYPVDNVLNRYYQFENSQKKDGHQQVTMDGNQALTLGLITAGVRYGAGYPITPWSTIMEMLRSELPKYGGTFVQAEDELAAVSLALGMAYSGHLSVTGSSGPGLSLKMEALGWAVMAELPLIVINIQRGGPSTGLPTNVEQGDLMQAIYGSHGDTPRIVLAPQNVEDCYYIALEAAHYARKYSTPVFILSDQALATRIEAYNKPELKEHFVDPKVDLTPKAADFLPYTIEKPTQRHAAPGTVMQGGKYPVVTGLEHDEAGHPTANPQLHMQMVAKRRNKIKQLTAELPKPEIYGDKEGDILLIGWGSTWGPLREAVIEARESGDKIGHLHLRHLNPMPNELERIFSRYRQIFVIEMNDEGLYGFGQLATLLRARYANPSIRSITKTDGLTYKVREILNGIQSLRSDAVSTFSSYPNS